MKQSGSKRSSAFVARLYHDEDGDDGLEKARRKGKEIEDEMKVFNIDNDEDDEDVIPSASDVKKRDAKS